jgi:hypothetical protein
MAPAGWLETSPHTLTCLFEPELSIGQGLFNEVGRLGGLAEKYPRYTVWLNRLDELKAVKKVETSMAKGRAKHGPK